MAKSTVRSRQVKRLVIALALGVLTTWAVAVAMVFLPNPTRPASNLLSQWTRVTADEELIAVVDLLSFGTQRKRVWRGPEYSEFMWGADELEALKPVSDFASASSGKPSSWSSVDRMSWDRLGESDSLVEEARGWPWVAFHCWAERRESEWVTHGGVALRSNPSESGSWWVDWRAIPLLPIWRGCIFDSAIYAFLWVVPLLAPSLMRSMLDARTGRRRLGTSGASSVRLRWILASTSMRGTAARLMVCLLLAFVISFGVAVAAEFMQATAQWNKLENRHVSAEQFDHEGKPLLLSQYRDWGWGYENRSTVIQEDTFGDGFQPEWHGLARAMSDDSPNPPPRWAWGFQPHPPIPESTDNWPRHEEYARGWPALAFWSHWSHNNSLSASGGAININSPAAALGRPPPTSFKGYWAASYLPIWRGLALDLAFYGVPLVVPLFGFSMLRSLRRLWYGRCPKCGYDIKHDFSAGCPECGWKRTAFTPGERGRVPV